MSQAEEQAEELVPTLLAQLKRMDGEPFMRYYEGDEGVAAVLRDILVTVNRL